MSIVSPSAIPTFLSEKGIEQVIAFSGGAASVPSEFGEDIRSALQDASKKFEQSVVRDALEKLRPYRDKIAILTGGTRYGVPATASSIAKETGFFTIGIFPSAGEEKALSGDILDLRVRVDICEDFRADTAEHRAQFRSDWGDESPHFAKTLDGVIVFGGRAGTMIEVAHLLKTNERRHKHKQKPKMIVPILASGGMAEATPYLPANPEVRDWCMPDRIVRSGADAAQILEHRLNLHDLLDQTWPLQQNKVV